MDQSSNPPLSDDSPRINPWTDDRLGHAGFARRMAEALARQTAPNGYVIGLHGEWGSGKSTVLNFVRRHLEKWREEQEAEVAALDWFDFEAWIVSGHQDLTSAFFKVLSEKIGDEADRRARWRRGTKAAIDAGAAPLIDATSKIGVIVDHTGGAASAAGAAISKAAIGKAAARWLAEPSLQKSHQQLVQRLRDSGRRFLVFIDDIDRLTSAEIRTVMQMVKTVGRLPNVTYCLAYDRAIVWDALREMAPGDTHRSGFAEKIVQHELEVPTPSRTGLMRMLEAGLPDLPPVATAGLRWMEMLQAGFGRWIRHPRDVARLSNAMQFAWPALEDEVDAHDLLCMEALRLFDRPVFDWVRDNRGLLLGEGIPIPGATGEESAQEARALGDRLAANARADVRRILGVLFPNRVDAFGGKRGFSTERWADVVMRRGIATAAGYTAYFSLSPSPAAIPKRMVDAAASIGVTRDEHLRLIDAALAMRNESDATLVGEYLHELSYRVERMQQPDLASLLHALVDRTMAIVAVDGDVGVFGPASNHHLLTGEVLGRLGKEASADTLDEIFAASDDVGALSAIYLDLARATGAIPTEGVSRRDYIAPERLKRLGDVLLPKIEAAHEADSLSGLPHYYEVARSWAHLAGSEMPRAWITSEAGRGATSLVKVSQGLLGISTDHVGRSFSMYSRPDTDIYDVDALLPLATAFDGAPELDDVGRARIAALRDGLAAWSRKADAAREDAD